jgi:uncharacterized protein YkwD
MIVRRNRNRPVTGFRGTIPCVSTRLAPALGLTAACAMLTAIGVIAIANSGDARQPAGLAGAVLDGGTGSGPVVLAAPTATSRPVNSVAAAPAGSARPAASTPSPPAGQSIRARQSSGAQSLVQAVYQAINQARTAQHLAPLGWDARLQQSAHTHNRAMAGANTLSHQVGAEPSLGNRESSAGVEWTYAAENIGWTTDRTLAGVLDIEARMLAESPPNDAHRRNIMARQAQTVGIDVYFDAAHGRLWLTEDFAGNR